MTTRRGRPCECTCVCTGEVRRKEGERTRRCRRCRTTPTSTCGIRRHTRHQLRNAGRPCACGCGCRDQFYVCPSSLVRRCGPCRRKKSPECRAVHWTRCDEILDYQPEQIDAILRRERLKRRPWLRTLAGGAFA